MIISIGGRELLAALGGAAAWPLRTRAEQVTRPAVGFLNSASADKYAYLAASFRQGLSNLGFVDGQNITIEYRWTASQYDRLSADHDSGVLSIRPLGSTNQYSLVSGLPTSRACTHLAWLARGSGPLVADGTPPMLWRASA